LTQLTISSLQISNATATKRNQVRLETSSKAVFCDIIEKYDKRSSINCLMNCVEFSC